MNRIYQQVTFTAMNRIYPECRGICPRDPFTGQVQRSEQTIQATGVC